MPPVAVPRIALDAMGGDHAPAATVAGALRAHAEHGVVTVLVGDAEVLRDHLGAARGDALEVVHAPEVIGMGEDPAVALRGKRGASIRVAAQLMADGRADGLVSAGSTGATMAAALLTLGRTPGVRRPAVGAVLPFGEGVVLVDAGATSDVQADALVAFARMGRAYAQARGVEHPRIGLLNVGAEPGKGSALAKEAFAALEGTPGFVGNVEPGVVVDGDVDVLVTDGFTGNVFLKTVEALLAGRGTAAASAGSEAPGGLRSASAASAGSEAPGGLRSASAASAGSEAPGGAVLLGCAGTVVVTHGAAGAAEVAAALRMASEVAVAGLPDRIAALLEDGSGDAGGRRGQEEGVVSG